MAEETGHRNGRTRLVSSLGVLIVIAIAVFLAIRAMAPPRVVPAGSPPAEFSAERAFRLLKDIAVTPHPLGTPAHDEVRDRILRMWRDLGFAPEVQKGVCLDSEGSDAARVENILVRLPGTNPVAGGALLLATHYDSVPPAAGAADDGAGVVTLLETARALKAGPPPARDVIFLATDGEEDGLFGAVLFQTEHPWAKDVGLVINFEARGSAGPSLMFQTSAGNRDLIAAYASVPHPRAYSFAASIYRSMPNDTDLSVWLDAGLQGLNFAFIGRSFDYHTAGDNLSRLDQRSLQHHGSSALALARRFGDGGIPPKSPGDAVYFSFFGDKLIRYSRTTAFLLVGVIAALLAAAGAVGIRRKMFRWPGLFRGVFFMLAALVLSGGLGFGFLTLVKAAHGSWLPAGPWDYSRGYFLALIMLAAGATALLHGLFRARNKGFATAYGAAVLWLVLAAAATVLAIDASYLAAGPALVLAVGVLAWAAGGKGLGAVLAAIGVVFIAAPVILLVFETMLLSPFMGAVLAVLVSIMLAAMTPAVEILRQGMGRRLPALFFALFLVLAVVSAFTAKYGDEIPRLASFQYLQDFDSGRAFWVTRSASPDSWTESIAGGKFQAGHPLPDSVKRPEAYFSREAPVSSPLPPEVLVAEDAVSGASRVLKLRIRAPQGGRLIRFSVKAEKLSAAAVEDHPLVLGPDEASGFTRAFFNPGPEGFELKIEAASTAPVRIAVRETNPGFPAFSDFVLPPVPPHIRPDRIETVSSKTFVFPLSGI